MRCIILKSCIPTYPHPHLHQTQQLPSRTPLSIRLEWECYGHNREHDVEYRADEDRNRRARLRGHVSVAVPAIIRLTGKTHISICSDDGRHDTHDTVESNGYAIASSTMRAWQDFWSVLGKLATFSRKVWLLCVKHTAYRVPCVKLAKF